ncbi:hypothetical protein EDD18DRAFT_1107304 [Armillaria luteobubalina]|uniref:Uncharacterized protein n=1 Tax=Armillaria luteobubalina TaxID=153913 RepID=A0AA39Q1W3_9AGAR|nr:hypothetical protein EDD18DRAFT_1107304 [Armillaria luteobubalina]
MPSSSITTTPISYFTVFIDTDSFGNNEWHVSAWEVRKWDSLTEWTHWLLIDTYSGSTIQLNVDATKIGHQRDGYLTLLTTLVLKVGRICCYGGNSGILLRRQCRERDRSVDPVVRSRGTRVVDDVEESANIALKVINAFQRPCKCPSTRLHRHRFAHIRRCGGRRPCREREEGVVLLCMRLESKTPFRRKGGHDRCGQHGGGTG